MRGSLSTWREHTQTQGEHVDTTQNIPVPGGLRVIKSTTFLQRGHSANHCTTTLKSKQLSSQNWSCCRTAGTQLPFHFNQKHCVVRLIKWYRLGKKKRRKICVHVVSHWKISSFTQPYVAQVFLHSRCMDSDGWFELCSKRGIRPSAAPEHSSIKATPVAHLLQGALLWPPHVSSDNHQASTFFIINNKRVVEVSASGSEPSGLQRSNSCGIRLQRARPSRRNKVITMSPSCHGGYVVVRRVWSSMQTLFQGFRFVGFTLNRK